MAENKATHLAGHGCARSGDAFICIYYEKGRPWSHETKCFERLFAPGGVLFWRALTLDAFLNWGPVVWWGFDLESDLKHLCSLISSQEITCSTKIYVRGRD